MCTILIVAGIWLGGIALLMAFIHGGTSGDYDDQ